MYQISALKRFSSLVHAFSTKSDGNMSFRFGKKREVLKNREKFLTKLNIDLSRCVVMHASHSEKVLFVDSSDGSVDVDGSITKKKNLYLLLLIADCLPIILYDPKKEILGLVHAGWRNTDNRIVEKAVKKIIQEFGSKPSDIKVAIGPAIHKESYIFDDLLQKNSKEWRKYVKKLRDGRLSVDLIGYTKEQLTIFGINPNNIFNSGVDTAKDQRFYSHYRDSRSNAGDSGRFVCVVGLR